VAANVLIVEDLLATTVGTVVTLRAWGNTVLIAKSVQAARTLLERTDFDCACIDQFIPAEEGGDTDATDEEIYRFAADIGQEMPFIWLTAHEVSGERMEIPGCIGRAEKSGSVTEVVAAKLARHVSSFVVTGLGDALDVVTVELEETAPGHYRAVVPEWRPDAFDIRGVLLPPWVRELVKAEDDAPVKLRARGWLGADRHGQLDLSAYEQISKHSQ